MPNRTGVEDGTLDLRTGKLRHQKREDLITKLCPVAYDPNAKAPLWNKFLQTIFDGKKTLIAYVQKLLDYCLTGSVSEQILPIFWGVGANGKSTLINTVLAMLGEDYAIRAAADLIMIKRGDSHPTERADLFGKRLCVCLETEENKRLAESLVKDLSGGDRQRARRMREDFWEFTPTHKLLLATNHKPEIRGTDHAIWRRVRLVPFTVVIAEDKQDKQLTEKLRGQLRGILAWCVQGCRDWQKEGLGLPEEVQQATSDYRSTQDILGGFFAECCITNPEYRVKAAKLYAAYLDWAKRSGEESVSQRRFGESMTERGFVRDHSNGVWYLGVAMPESEPN